MSDHISGLTIIAAVCILLLMIVAIYTWLTYLHQKLRQRILEKKAKSLLSALRGSSGDRIAYTRTLAEINKMQLPEASPWFSALQWVVPRCLSRSVCRQRVADAVQQHYRPLVRQIEWVKNIAPPIGLLFTVLGLVVVLFKQSQGLDHGQMLGDIGVALFTTAFSSMVLIAQITLLSKLNSLMEMEFETGMQLIETLFDISERTKKKKRRAIS